MTVVNQLRLSMSQFIRHVNDCYSTEAHELWYAVYG